MALSNYVNVTVDLNARAIAEDSFDTILISTYHDIGDLNQRVSSYSSLKDMLDADFTVNSTAYKKAQPIFAQANPPKLVKVGKRSSAVTHTIDLTPTVTTVGFVYRLTIDGTEIEYEVVADDTVALICDALVAAINPLASVVATDGTTKVTVTAATAGDIVTITDRSRELTLLDTTAATNLATDIAAYMAEDDNWYGLILDINSEATTAAAAAAIETAEKLLFVEGADTIIGTSSSVDMFSVLVTGNYAKTSAWFHPNLSSGLAGAIMARAFSLPAGTEKYSGNSLRGVATAKLNSTERQYVLAKNGSYFELAADQALTFNGKVASGDWVDLIRGVAWLKNQMRIAILRAVSNGGNPGKVPFNPAGLERIRAAGQQVLDAAVARGFINIGTKDDPDDPQPIFTVPAYTSFSANDRNSRIVGGVVFTSRASGIIHTVNVIGSVEG